MAMKTIDCLEGNLPHEISDLLVKLASNWGDDIEGSALKVEHLKGGITNKVYKISWPTENAETSRNVFVRLYGKGLDVFFNRDKEIQTFELISRLGFGPDLLAKFPTGRVEEFIHGRTLSADDLRNTEISCLIAAKVREFHQLDMPGPKNPVIWDNMRTWLSEAKEICTLEHTLQFRLQELDDEISQLEKEFPGEQNIGFCHNDLQYSNIMIDDNTNLVTLIDYEYASYNPVAYDIANHFLAMIANFHSETQDMFDYNLYPGVEERHRFIRAYLSSGGHEPNESEIEKLSEEAEKYSLVSYIYSVLWAIISAYKNSIDFDYMEFARQRFQQYWVKKSQLLGISSIRRPTKVANSCNVPSRDI